jgi:hypothetical protein
MEPISLAYIWIPLGAAVVLLAVLVFFAPRLMGFLDRLEDKRHSRRKMPPENRVERESDNNDG